MKKVLVPYQREEFVKYCDKHNKRECAGDVWISFGYGSKFDCSEIKLDICDECAEKLMKYLEKEFGEKAKRTDASLL